MQKSRPSSLHLFKAVVDSLALTLGPHYEFVIHDFADPAHSLIHIAGNITKRGVGAPLTGRLLKAYREHGDNVQDILNVQLKGPDGRPIRSSSIFIRNANGKVIGSLGVNIDLSDYQAAKRLIDNLCLGVKTMETEALQPTSDAQFPNTYAEAIDEILNETVQSHSRFLDKDQRMELVRELDNKGVFLMKGAVEEVASRLGVSKFSIYKYLKELRTDGDTNEASGS